MAVSEITEKLDERRNIMEQVKKYADEMQELSINSDCISRDLFSEFNVKRGLRDEKGKGILTGLTNIS